MATVREFVNQAYFLISAANPVVPLHGNDLKTGIFCLNLLLNNYASDGLLLTIAKEAQVNLAVNQAFVTVGPASAVPIPDITLGRLANLDSAWLLLNGVTYPLITEDRDEYLAAWKYDPLQGLPRFILLFADTEIVRLRLYPAPSQFFELHIRGKFQLPNVDSNDDMSALPDYYRLFLLYALAKEVAYFTARAEAWTEKLEARLQELQDKMEASSERNLTITGDRESLLNGAWRVRAGI